MVRKKQYYRKRVLAMHSEKCLSYKQSQVDGNSHFFDSNVTLPSASTSLIHDGMKPIDINLGSIIKNDNGFNLASSDDF